MRGHSPPGEPLGRVVVGAMAPAQVREEFARLGVGLNDHAELLMARPEMLLPSPVELDLLAVTVAQLGFPQGATLPQVHAAARERGLAPCPLATGPALRLVHREAESLDAAMRRQRPPQGALHVASAVLDRDVEVPRGFYLRTVEGRLWLRGYRCDDEYVLGAETTHVFDAGSV